MAEFKKAVVRLDKVASVYNGPLASIKASFDLENGMLVALDKLADGQREVFNVKPVANVDATKDTFVLHASPELLYNESVYFNEDDIIVDGNDIGNFYVPAGKVGRAYFLNVGDIITVSDKLIDGETKVGEYVVPSNTKTMKAATSYTDEKLVFQVIAKENLGGGQFGIAPVQPSTVLLVIKA